MKEHEIRPEALLNRYLELSAQDAEKYFGDTIRTMVPCVACGGKECPHQFKKNGFDYAQCDACGTLFQTPRPPLAAFEAFYGQSESCRYWAEVFSPAVAEIRREKIFRPRVDRLAGICAERGIDVQRLIDVGAGYGIFLDEWQIRFPQVRTLAIEPSASLAKECRAKGFIVVEDIVENVVGHDNFAEIVTCFEVLEHVYNPLDFVRVLKGLVLPGGYVFVSTLGIDGFDLQVLWEKSTQIFPPHHINFLSVCGFEHLFQRAGFVDVTIATPGKLDVDIVRNASSGNPERLHGQRFLHNLLEDDNKSKAFQCFLTEQRMSSHVWVFGRKPS